MIHGKMISAARHLRAVAELSARSRIGRGILFRWDLYRWRRQLKRWANAPTGPIDGELSMVTPSGRRRK